MKQQTGHPYLKKNLVFTCLQDSFHNPTLIDYVSATLYKIHSEALEIDIAWPHMNKLAYIKFPYLLMQGVGRDPAHFR